MKSRSLLPRRGTFSEVCKVSGYPARIPIFVHSVSVVKYNESHSFLPVKTALEQSEQGNCTKPDCNQYPGSFLIHGSSPLVSSTISSLIIAHFFPGSLPLAISKY